MIMIIFLTFFKCLKLFKSDSYLMTYIMVRSVSVLSVSAEIGKNERCNDLKYFWRRIWWRNDFMGTVHFVSKSS